MGVPFATGDEIASFAGGESSANVDQYEEAAYVVSEQIRAYVGSEITSATRDVVLSGTRDRRLVVGERTLTEVSAVSVRVPGGDVAALTDDDFSWNRAGTLWRALGWGGPDAEVTATITAGYATVPEPIHVVTMTAALRHLALQEQGQANYVSTDGGYATRFEVAPVSFALGELQVLDRYRRKTWPVAA